MAEHIEIEAYVKKDDEYIITYQFQKNDMIYFFRKFSKKFLWQKVWVATLLVTFYLGDFLRLTFVSQLIICCFSFIIFAIFILSNFYIKRILNIFPGYEFMLTNQTVFEISLKYVHVKYKQIHSYYYWGSFVNISEDKKFINCLLINKQRLIIPHHIFPSELDKANFIHFLKTQMLLAKEHEKDECEKSIIKAS